MKIPSRGPRCARRSLALCLTVFAALVGPGCAAQTTASGLAAPGGERWRHEADGDYAFVAAGGGTVAVASGELRDRGRGLLTGLDATTGEARWRVRLPAPAFLPVVSGRNAYVGTVAGHVFAVDAASGRVRWRARPLSGPARVLVRGGRVVAADADPEDYGQDLLEGGGRTALASLDAATGRVRWRFSAARAGRFVEVHAAAGPGAVYVGTDDHQSTGFVIALSAATGRERWRVRSGFVSSPPAAEGSVLFVPSSAGDLQARAVRTGRLLWRRPPRAGGVPYFPEAFGDAVYTSTNTHHLEARRTGDGALRWRFVIGDNFAVSRATRRAVYVVFGGRVQALDPRSGRRLWLAVIPAGVAGPPALDPNSIYAPALDGSVLAIVR